MQVYKSCGDTVQRNGTYFVSSGASFGRGVSTCNINIQKLSPTIRHIRLELHTFIVRNLLENVIVHHTINYTKAWINV